MPTSLIQFSYNTPLADRDGDGTYDEPKHITLANQIKKNLLLSPIGRRSITDVHFGRHGGTVWFERQTCTNLDIEAAVKKAIAEAAKLPREYGFFPVREEGEGIVVTIDTPISRPSDIWELTATFDTDFYSYPCSSEENARIREKAIGLLAETFDGMRDCDVHIDRIVVKVDTTRIPKEEALRKLTEDLCGELRVHGPFFPHIEASEQPTITWTERNLPVLT